MDISKLKIYCLHCVEDVCRYDNIIKQFNKLDLNVQMWETCRQPHMDILYTGIILSNNYENICKYNEYNCLREHYTIIKTSYLKGYENILIFEDDIFLLNDKSLFIDFINNIPDDYDICRLGGFCNNDHPELNESFKSGLYWKKLDFGVWGTQGFILSRKGMKYFIDYIDNVLCPADWPLFVNTNFEPIYGKLNYKKDEINQYISTIPLLYIRNDVPSSIRNTEEDSCFNFYKNIDIKNYI